MSRLHSSGLSQNKEVSQRTEEKFVEQHSGKVFRHRKDGNSATARVRHIAAIKVGFVTDLCMLARSIHATDNSETLFYLRSYVLFSM